MSVRLPLWWRAGRWLLMAAVLAAVVFCLAWRLGGGRWERVETPSMGTVAPVGSLLWVQPVDFDSLRPGDFVTFHPPGDASLTYSHLVEQRNADGTITTKGVIPATDPWRLSADDVVGEVRMSWWGVGWLVEAAPVIVPGLLLVGAAHSFAGARWRIPLAIVLGTLVICATLVVYRPLTHAQQLAFAPTNDGGADATYVSTGLLPMRLAAEGGEHVDLSPGEVGTVHVAKVDDDHRLSVRLGPAIPFWWWAALVLACFLPALVTTVAGVPRPDH